ncbi:MAG: CBS domain-containing protein [Candidatus Altiarchaeales archaeon]|nr:MAG: CBS domain-containing protein [Candidatus Altiarchaeales archaeon]
MPIGKSDIGKSMDRGPKEFKTHMVDKEGNVMLIAEKNVITTHPLNSIKNVARLMKEHDFRRIPVTDAGTNRLEGMAVAIDILDFLGGGEKYNIILEDYNGNFLSAINCPINKIMNPDHPFLDRRTSIDDVVDIMMEKRTSAIPIVEDPEVKEVIAIVTERDVLPLADEFGVSIRDAMRKKCITSSPGMMISDVSKIMVRNRLRRLPVILEDELKGIVTVFDVLKFLGYGEFKGINAEEVLSNTRVEEIMEKRVISVDPDQDLALIPKLVKETNIGGFPVVEDGKILGIITTSDVIRKVYKE